MRSPTLRGLAAVVTAAVAVVLSALPASAADGSIDHVEPGENSFSALFSLADLPTGTLPDLDSVSVAFDGQPLTATAEPADQAAESVRRTTVLAFDVSNSMRRDGRFTAAKEAAATYLDAAPEDVYVGIVTFAGGVEVIQQPSLDREESARLIDDLSLSSKTRLYDGIDLALETAGSAGQRNVLVLSDGRDVGSDTSLDQVVRATSDSGVITDVVALAQGRRDEALLRQIAEAGSGNVFSADDPKALTDLFARQATELATQILVTAELPSDHQALEGSVSISLDAGEETYADRAFVTVASRPRNDVEGSNAAAALPPVKSTGPTIGRDLMLGGLGAAGVGLLILLLTAFGVFSRPKKATLAEQVSAYSQAGRRKATAPRRATGDGQQPTSLSASAVGVAQKALKSNKGLEAALGTKLDAAGLSLKPAEWLLAHAGVAFFLGLVALLLTSGSLVAVLVALVFGLVLPWLYLSFKRSRRVKAFNAGLADTLQLMSGSLSAGLSLAQSVDTVVREGADPIATEFRRALMETRLGVEIEDALESIAERMGSKDFEWVVMAIRIQREVGGNLSELLLTVAGTIREREYLVRHVAALSAEGRLSVWVLGGLPPGFMAYLAVANPEYLSPLISTPLGWVMLVVMTVLLIAGVLWMKKLVKVAI